MSMGLTFQATPRMYKLALTKATRKDVASPGKLYGHDAKEDGKYNPESELRSWKVHPKLTI